MLKTKLLAYFVGFLFVVLLSGATLGMWQYSKIQTQIQKKSDLILQLQGERDAYRDSLEHAEMFEINQTINNYNAEKIKQVIKK